MRGTRVMRPLTRSRTIPSTLGRDNEVLRIRGQCLRDQLFTDVRPVGVGGIYKVHAKLHGTPQNCQCSFAIFWFAPDAFASKAHRPEAETMDRKLTAERNIPRQTCRVSLRVHN